MATGANDPFWEGRGLPSVLKHDLLRRYLPRFAGKTGSRAQSVVCLDGYAGRGRYDDGSPASAEHVLWIAQNQAAYGVRYKLFFYEPDPASYQKLKEVVAQYAAQGVDASAERASVLSGLDQVVDAARGKPLFLFLDPCGLGVPFPVLVATLTGPRAAAWPPTEVLLNFSLHAVRRIAGHVASQAPNERSMARLDEALGGRWWRDLVAGGVTDLAVSQVVHGFIERLSNAAGMRIVAIPVRKVPSHKPIYFLVFGTRSPLGVWHFADDTARATATWWEAVDARQRSRDETIGQGSLFGDLPLRATLEDVEAEACPEIAANISWLLARHGPFRVGDYPAEVFGDYLGRVRETVVRAAIKNLHASGRASSDGKGSPITSLIVTPPT